MKPSPSLSARPLRRPVLCALVLMLAPLAALSQAVISGWEGIRAPTGSVPPDPHGAPGPEGIIATVNLRISYYTKSGALVWGPTNLSTFWSPAGNTGAGLSDPKAIFDHASRRFFVIVQENTGSRFWFNVAVSRNSDPRTAGAADWRFYRIDATEFAGGNGAGGVNYGGDYPGLAVDNQALYATYRMYAFNPNGTLNGCGCNFTNVALLILNKNNLMNGTPTLASVYLSGFNTQPVSPYGTGPGNVMYLVEGWNAGFMRIVAVSDPLGTRTQTSQFLTVANRGGGPTNGAPQLGSASQVPTIVRTHGNASLVGGDIWYCSTDGQPGGPAVACYYRVRLNGWPASGSPTIVEDSTVGSGSFWNFCPAIGVNQAGDVAITWTRSSSSVYPTMMYAYRNAGDGAFGAEQAIQASQAASNDGRWGDYFSVWPDPNDGSLWLVSQWTRSDTGTWSTWWAQVQTPARDLYVDNTSPWFFEFGTFTFPYKTVTRAVENATRGTIYIAGHNYNEFPVIYKNVLLWPYNGTAVIGAP